MIRKIEYNSPVILTFALLAVGIHVLTALFFPGLTRHYFTLTSGTHLGSVLGVFRLFSHVLGHASWDHLLGNLLFLLLLGPLLEEKYGKPRMLLMILAAALATGLVSLLVFNTGLLGASGIVFMMIVLSSVVNFKRGTIPLTFILVAGIFIGTEILKSFQADNVSQLAHIIGGGVGAIFGFRLPSR